MIRLRLFALSLAFYFACGGGEVAPYIAETNTGDLATESETVTDEQIKPEIPDDYIEPDGSEVAPDSPQLEDTALEPEAVLDSPISAEELTSDSCTPQCSQKQCGPDGCGGICGECTQGAQCIDGICKCVPNHTQSCCQDNKGLCWYDSCGNQGAKIKDCPGGCNGNVCIGCTPDCTGKQCGPDGCGGTCGECTQGAQCIDGICKCVPNHTQSCCQDKKGLCWYDSCGNQGVKIKDCSGGCNGNVCIECNPDCTGKQCGTDGCGGTCGLCQAGDSCVAGQCISPEPCTGLPQNFSASGAINTMSTPLNNYKTKCFDYTGDGIGDNGLSVLEPYTFLFNINQLIAQALSQGQMGMVFEFQEVTNFVNAPPFLLAGLRGLPAQGGYRIDPASYDGHCNPLVAFKDATIVSSVLKAGPGYFIFLLPLGGLSMTLALEKARMTGSITSGGPGGVTMTNGVLSGLLTQEALDSAIADLETQCNIPNPPQYCQFIGLLPNILQNDVDMNGDGIPDAISVCFELTLKPVKVIGYL